MDVNKIFGCEYKFTNMTNHKLHDMIIHVIIVNSFLFTLFTIQYFAA